MHTSKNYEVSFTKNAKNKFQIKSLTKNELIYELLIRS